MNIFSAPRLFSLLGGLAAICGQLLAAPTHLVQQSPISITQPAPGVWLVDFGKVAFGNLSLRRAPDSSPAELAVHFGEDFQDGRINRTPPGTVRYAAVKLTVTAAETLVAPPPDLRNTQTPERRNTEAWKNVPGMPQGSLPPAILTPDEWGVLLPFRWIEIEGWDGELTAEQVVRRVAFPLQWDDEAAAFTSSNEMLNQVWELCRYSIKATAFAGIYLDGDRERIPYEADAYLNQLSDYAVNGAPQMARDTFDHLMVNGTWPTEWASHMVFMAYADWWHTADRSWLEKRYASLRAKLLLERVGPEGLVTSNDAQMGRTDLVDWPKRERDGFVFTPLNSVVNAFYLRSLAMMIEMGQALGHASEVAEYTRYYEKGLAAYQEKFFIGANGICVDGVGTEHSSLHANALALAFDLAPAKSRAPIAAWLQTKSMKCSVYLAQYYLEALFRLGAGQRSVELMLAPGDRSWRHMLERGATITWEAWDAKYKPNLDWNHAWGAAPANLLPRFVLGVEASVPGWSRVRIAPEPSGLSFARGQVPTPHGPISVDWTDGQVFRLNVRLPKDVAAEVRLPATTHATGVYRNNQQVAARREGGYWILSQPVVGDVVLEVR